MSAETRLAREDRLRALGFEESTGGIGGVVDGATVPVRRSGPAIVVCGEMGRSGLAMTPIQDRDGRLGILVTRAQGIDGVELFMCGTKEHPAESFAILDITVFGRQP